MLQDSFYFTIFCYQLANLSFLIAGRVCFSVPGFEKEGGSFGPPTPISDFSSNSRSVPNQEREYTQMWKGKEDFPLTHGCGEMEMANHTFSGYGGAGRAFTVTPRGARTLP